MIIGVSRVEFEEGSHLEKGTTNVGDVQRLPQLFVDADDLANVAENSDYDVVWNDLVLP